MDSQPRTDRLADIRQENLTVYHSSPQRLREDVGQEAQISQDYRGRLLYELLQNADDAMEEGDPTAKIVCGLLPRALWMPNSGRPLDEPDIEVDTHRYPGRTSSREDYLQVSWSVQVTASINPHRLHWGDARGVSLSKDCG
jgi:hypothetical protein